MTETRMEASTGDRRLERTSCAGANLLRRGHRGVVHLRRLYRRMVAYQEVRDVLLEVRTVCRDRHQRRQTGKELAQRLQQHPVLIQVEARQHRLLMRACVKGECLPHPRQM